jgi:TolB-like protein
VFLSYASQDSEAAARICSALTAAGIEVWFDQSELRGGDAWDRQIRKQIRDCALFVPVISAHSDARSEGYFRREWRLAVDRTADMAEDVAFLLPVVIDGTPDATARVPDRFRDVQWSRLPDGQASPAFTERVQRLLSASASATPAPSANTASRAAPAFREPAGEPRRSRSTVLIAVAAVVAAVLAIWAADKLWISKHMPVSQPTAPGPATTTPTPTAAVFAPPPHSIAVLPLVNMSGDKEQEYFADGMTEELITALSQVSSLKVIARTSCFAFKGRNVDVGAIARTLNVSSILEGSVRRAGSTVRVTVQLINGQDGFHLWSQDYDRDLKNILAMQSDVAIAVAQQLKAKLLGDESAKIELGGTRSPEAYDAFLRGREMSLQSAQLDSATTLLEKAVRLDAGFARAWALLAELYIAHSEHEPTRAVQWHDRARVAADTALRLAPQFSYAHTKMASVDATALDWPAAERDIEIATALDANAPSTLNARGNLSFQLGRWQDAIAAAHAAIKVDPLNPGHRFLLAAALSANGQYRDAEATFREIGRLKLDAMPRSLIAQMILMDGRPADALTEAGQISDRQERDYILTMTYHALGRNAESDRLMTSYEREHASDDAFTIAMMHAYRGETDLAFQWLDRAVLQHDPALFVIKGNFSTFPNVTRDPRYPELLRKIGLPAS